MKKYFHKYSLLSLFVFTVITSNAQQGWWTWMKGGNLIGGGATANWGTQGVAAPTNLPPPLYKTDACWTDSQGKYWFYGGDMGLSALWKYDPVTNNWTWMKGPNTAGVPAVYGTKGVAGPTVNPPVVGIGGTLTWVDANDNLWLWGGGSGSLANTADMWKYDPLTNMWTWMHGPGIATTTGVYGVLGVPSPANYPTPRYETCASWVDNAGNFWLFGGGVATGQINDMWRYNPVSNEWTWMHGSNIGNVGGNYGTKGVAAASNLPPFRWPYCRWTDNTGKFWMFGGSGVNNNTDSYNDMWSFDPAANQWTWVSGSNTTNPMPAYPQRCTPSTTAYPQGRYENPIAWKDKCGNLWMYSGQWTAAQGFGLSGQSDVWCYKPTTNEWVFVGGNMPFSEGTQGVAAGSNSPGNAYGAGAFVSNNEFYFFGGRLLGGGNSQMLWKYIPDSTCAKSFCNPPPVLPVAHFSADTLIGCAPLTVQFFNTSLNATSWIWDFGDGSPTSNVQNPSHTYNTPGNYTVTLIVSNATQSDTLTYANYVNVIPQASVTITPSADTICVGQTVTFTTNATNALGYFWIIPGITKGDTMPTFSYTFNSLGVYQVVVMVDGPYGCNSSDTVDIYVLTGVTLTQNVSLCSGNTYTLPGGQVVSAPGTYIDTLGNTGCDSIITTIITTSPAGTFTQSPTICVGGTFTLPDGSTTSAAGTYTDTISNGPCDSIVTTILSVVTSFNINVSDTICTGNAYTLPDGTTTSVAGTYIDTLNATLGNCDSIITTSLVVTQAYTNSQSPVICAGNGFTLPGGNIVTTGGNYQDTLQTGSGCDSIITTNLTVKPNSTSTLSATICSDSSYTLPSGTIVNASGMYNDTIPSANGCDSIITVTLVVNPSPVIAISNNVTIYLGQSTTLTATGGGTYDWNNGSSLNDSTTASVIATPSQTTTYCVLVTNSNGCKDTACVTVTIDIPCPVQDNLAVPNAFSPNGDNVNDEFCLMGWENCIKEFNVRIYDRWGEKVFESNQSDFCWDGVYKGKSMEAAVFVYYIKARFTNVEDVISKTGNISLIR